MSSPLYEILLRVFGRTPNARDMELWSDRLARGMKAENFVRMLAASPAVAANPTVPQKNPPGHFFSPVVNPELVRGYVAEERAQHYSTLGGIDARLEAQTAFWLDNAACIAALPYPAAADAGLRYQISGEPYPLGDAAVLWAMMHANRPRRVVELGAGYSSAVMLDAATHAGLEPFQLVCIEPNPKRLLGVMRPEDAARVTVLARGAQGADLDLFAGLQAGDILFIDSTHVMKTGSDVHYVMFHVLPVLRPGVLVHVHDCRYPFEYSDVQIFEKNYSWNEAYAVRALLMWSTRLEVAFWGSLFALERHEMVAAVLPAMLENPGSAIWLRVSAH